jgi:hypothetical protein
MFRWAERRARNLLRNPSAIVRRTVICALTIYGIGCIVPTPLEAEQANHSPFIVRADPPFGRITKARSEAFKLDVVVRDEDERDELSARLLQKDGERFRPLYGDTLTLTPVKDTPTERRGTFNGTHCELLVSANNLAYVFVTDGKFNGSTPLEQITEPMSRGVDSRFWVLDCQ